MVFHAIATFTLFTDSIVVALKLSCDISVVVVCICYIVIIISRMKCELLIVCVGESLTLFEYIIKIC